MLLRGAVRTALHCMGGLGALRLMQRSKCRIAMFHEFHPGTCQRMDEICAHIVRYFEPLSLTRVASALIGGRSLPANALVLTVDDGYRNFLEYGHPVFRKYRIPTTVFAVTGFSDGQLWLWTDRVAFAIGSAVTPFIAFLGEEFDLTSPECRMQAMETLWERFKNVPNERRRNMVEELARSCGVALPETPPADRRALSWEELRALSAEEVEIGCHTYSHPILSRVEGLPELEREIRGAREVMESNLGFRINHFCYPNGRDIDIGSAAAACVRDAGYMSAVTCTYGLNTIQADPLRLRRVPLHDGIDFEYGKELLAGLHM